MPQLLTASATRIAREYLNGYADIPISTYAKPRRYNADAGYRTYEACYGCMQTNEVYVLLVLHVHDDGTVTVHEDRRDVVRAMLQKMNVVLPGRSYALANVSEQFENAMREQSVVHPDWYRGFRMVTDQNCDALLTIVKEDGRYLDVPLMLFRTKTDKSKFFSTFAKDPDSRMSIVIPFEMSKAEIRRTVIDQLEKRRTAIAGREGAA